MSGGAGRDLSRTTLVALAVGAIGYVADLLLGLVGVAVMPSYLGAWLFVLALPLGALPVVMGCELLDVAETRVTVMLRRLVAIMPLAALLAIPVLIRLNGLYPVLSIPKHGLPGWWMTPGFFVVRAILFLVVWTILSFLFARPPGAEGSAARRPAAVLGLGLHFCFGTLAAFDWVQAAEPGFNSSASGLLLIAVWSGIAVSLAVALATTGARPASARALSPDRRDLTASRRVAIALAVLLAAWGFLVFTQYLVVWSANLPREVAWYQHRSAGFGQFAEYSAGILVALALLALLPRDLSRHAGLLAWVAAALVVMHGLELLWLVTPAFRTRFSILPADLFALAGAAGLGIGSVLMLGDRARHDGEVRHGAA